MSSPAENLCGEILNDRWEVVEGLRASRSTTGGCFSIPYRVIDRVSGKQAFLKVIDLIRALSDQYNGIPVYEAIQRVVDNHAFEVFLSETCKNRKMSRVVHAIDSGEFQISISGLNLKLPFIVFDYADGDIHSLLSLDARLDLAWKLQVLHQVATGLRQLHSAEIAHQDIKRSNVVFFGSDDGRITDLGRAVKRGASSRNDGREIPCQWSNAAPERIYGYEMADWTQRHFATDLYMFGNLCFTILFNVTMTAGLIHRIPDELRPHRFRGTYQEVLPGLQLALSETLVEIEGQLPHAIRKEYLELLRMLCEPDPTRRGHPLTLATSHGNRYSMERIISLVDVIRRKAAMAISQ